MTFFNYSIDIAYLIEWAQNKSVDIYECLGL